MKLTINNETVELGEGVTTLQSLVEIRNIPSTGSAIALNGRLVVRSRWSSTRLKDNDDIIVITAAYGG